MKLAIVPFKVVVVAATTGLFSVGCAERCTLAEPLCDIAVVTIEPGDVVLTAPGQSVQLSLVARDAAGVEIPMDSATIQWVVSDASVSTVSATGLITAVASGRTSVSATSSLLPDSSKSVTISVDLEARPSQLGVEVHPGGASVGALLNPQPVVHLLTSDGRLVTSDLVVTATKFSGSGTLLGTLSVAAVGGIASFTDLSVSGATGVHSLQFTAQDVGEAFSLPFSVYDPAVVGDAPQFSSDWRTATGSSVAAMTDGGKWPTWSWGGSCPTNPAACEVKIIDEADFPSGRAFYGGYHGNRSSTGVPTSGGGNVLVDASDNRWPIPTIGQTIFHRFYLKNTINAPRFGRNLGAASHHPVEGWGTDPELGGNCAFHWEYRYDARADGTYSWNIANLRGQGDWFKRGLLLGRAYLMEVAYTRTGPTSWQVRARLDGVDQGQIFPADAQIGSYCLRSLFVGNNDPGDFGGESRWRNSDGSPVAGGPYFDLDAMRWGAFAVAVRNSATDWIGPYDLARGW